MVIGIRIQKLLALIWKELLVVLKDPKSRISIFLPPIVELVIFTYAATLDVNHVTIGVVNQDLGKSSFELLQRLHGSSTFKKIVYLENESFIAPFLNEQKGMLVVSIGELFSRNIKANQVAEIQVISDGRKSNSAQIVTGYISEIVDQFHQELEEAKGGTTQKMELISRNWFNPNITYLWYNIPCLVCVLSMLTCLIVTSQSVAREREMGTFDQLLVSPLSTVEILIGKIVPGILIGLGEGSFMWGMGTILLQVPFTGSIFLFIVSLTIFVTAMSGVGLFISSLSATQQQAMIGTFVFMLPSVLLAGFATPIENMPEWLQPVTFLLPLRYMLILAKGLFLKNIGVVMVLQQLWPMLCIALFTLVIATLFFRRRLQ